MKIISSKEFKKTELDKFLNRGKSDLSSIVSTVQQIISYVKENGNAALVEYTEKFDKVSLKPSSLRVSEAEIKQAYKKLDQKQIDALQTAADNIAAFHKKQIREKWTMQTTQGVTLGQVMRPLASVGVYAPGGKAAYPSSVLMSAIPAKVAGVERVIVCSPPRQGEDISSALLVAADIAGVDEVYRVGGAQAIAAMAYGTKSMESVAKIVGPGNGTKSA